MAVSLGAAMAALTGTADDAQIFELYKPANCHASLVEEGTVRTLFDGFARPGTRRPA